MKTKSALYLRTIIVGSALSVCSGLAAASSINLSNYTLAGSYSLPSVAASEASAVTYNWDTGSLFVLGDEGDALVEVSRTGEQISLMRLGGFDDTEGLTYIGKQQFVITEEREQDAYLLTYSAGGAVIRSSLAFADMGPNVGNSGIEGISWDAGTNTFFTVKEKSPQAVNQATLTFGKPGLAIIDTAFTPDFGVADLSDIQVLSTILPAGSDGADNLLIFSQESALLLEVTRDGTVLGSFDFDGISSAAEGVTIDEHGIIYLVGEEPTLFVLAPSQVPVPAAVWLFGSALAGLCAVGRKRRHR